MQISSSRVLKFFSIAIVIIAIAIIFSHNFFDKNISNVSSLPSSQYRIVEDAIGKNKVPIYPQKIVTLHGAALESVLALNEKPIGTTLNGQLDRQANFIKNNLDNVEFLGSFEQPNLEKILLVKPDLILDLDTTNIYSQLSKIAPTVVAKYQPKDGWQPNLKLYAEALGKPEAAEKIIANYYDRIKKFKIAMSDRKKLLNVSVVRVYPQGISVYQKNSFSGSILSDAGISRPKLQNREGIQQFISKELISEIDADVIFLWSYGDDYKSNNQKKQKILDNLQSDPLWLQLNAVKQKKVYQVPDYWIGYGPLAANAIVDDLFKYLLKN